MITKLEVGDVVALKGALHVPMTVVGTSPGTQLRCLYLAYGSQGAAIPAFQELVVPLDALAPYVERQR